MQRRVPRRPRAAAAVAVVLALSIGSGACASGASIAKPDFLNRGNAMCQQGSTEWDALVKKLPTSSVAAREDYVKKKLAPLLSNVVNGLRSLGHPSGDGDYLESIYADADREIAQLVDKPSTNLQARIDAPFASPAPRFESYGLDRCAEL